MKNIFILAILFFTSSLNAQIKVSYPHCKCEDEIEQTEPNLNGIYKRTCKGIVMEEGTFKNGKKDGNWKTKSIKGKLIKEFNFSDGVLNGGVKLFYLDGTKKMEGNFIDGQKDGLWQFYNIKGKIIKTGIYQIGTPKGIWKVFDSKGKKEVIVYNFDENNYIKEEENIKYLEKDAIVQNENSEEWYIIHNFKKENKSSVTPFEGYILANDFYTNLLDIPYDMWDTYIQNDFTTTIEFKNNEVSQISIDSTDAIESNCPIFNLLISTNDKGKLTEVEHSQLSKKILEHKIIETLWLMGPWIGENETKKVRTAYVINKFTNSPYH